MRCYRRLNPIKAISFDLDDTLYNNWPIIEKAEQAQLKFLQQNVPQAHNTNSADWLRSRHLLLNERPELRHDIGQLRQQGIYCQLRELGLNQSDAQNISLQAFTVFHQQRIKVVIDAEVINLLCQLAEHYPLIALTNGNACINAMGLGEVFQFAILAGDDGIQQKPSRQMFDVAAQQLSLQTSGILHIGDSLTSDVQGALNAGAMAVWYNPNNSRLNSNTPLPHLQINHLSQLNQLL